ncbi:Geranylgeranyl transferase type-1 subunit beta, partial [Coelomomyces lativittatus]
GFRSAPEIPDADAASTYSALLSLLILGDDLSKINRAKLQTFIKNLAGNDGGYHQYPIDPPSEPSDLRFTYCVVVISHLLNLSFISINSIVAYVQSTYTFDGSFGSSHSAEGHGGYTYCAVSILSLLNRLPTSIQLDRLICWCLKRQGNGFAGRINKPEDTCYSFWIGASLKILGAFQFVDHVKNSSFLSQLQSKHGGFGKEDPEFPDVVHTYFCLAAFSLMNTYPLKINPLIPALNLSQHVYQRYLATTANVSHNA